MKLLTITVYKLYIHYNGVIIYATKNPGRQRTVVIIGHAAMGTSHGGSGGMQLQQPD